MLMQSMPEIFQRKAATLMVCCLLCGGFANQARQPLLLGRAGYPGIEIPDLSKSTVKTISFSWPDTGAGVFGVWPPIHPVLAELRSHQGIDIADPM